jgi:hypothetical protein
MVVLPLWHVRQPRRNAEIFVLCPAPRLTATNVSATKIVRKINRLEKF